MLSGGGPGLQSREGGNRIVPGGFDSHPFRQCSGIDWTKHFASQHRCSVAVG